jgi:sulfur carrier protein
MTLRINGEDKRFTERIETLERLLSVLGIPCSRVAVERNGEIVAPGAFAETFLRDEDRIEIVSFVGGG